MKNKKGFTLVELIAIIAILSVIMVISLTSYRGIRKRIVDKDYNNLVALIETKAEKYAKETGITTVNVQTLIDEGYLEPDDDKYVYDPKDKNNNLNCNILTIDYKNNDYDATMGESQVENGVCKTYEKTSEYEICEVKGDKCEKITDSWHGNITLGIRKMTEKSNLKDANVEYSWSTNSGFTSKESTVLTNVQEGTITYQATVKINDKLYNVRPATIKFDTKAPEIIKIKLDESSKKWVTPRSGIVEATDHNGSGVNEICISENQTCTEYKKIDGNSTKININIPEKGKNYYVFLKDRAGNTSSVGTSIIDNEIDNEAPVYASGGSVKLNNNNVCNSGAVITAPKFTDNVSGVKNIYYYILENNATPTNNDKSTIYTKFDTKCATTYYIWAVAEDNAGNKSNPKKIAQITTCDKGVYKYTGQCSWNGYQIETRYNGCTHQNESRVTSKTCNSATSYSSWGSCSSNGWQYRTGTYYNGGRAYTVNQSQACTSSTSCGGWGSCTSSSIQYRTCYYYYGGNSTSYSDSQSCYYSRPSYGGGSYGGGSYGGGGSSHSSSNDNDWQDEYQRLHDTWHDCTDTTCQNQKRDDAADLVTKNCGKDCYYDHDDNVWKDGNDKPLAKNNRK